MRSRNLQMDDADVGMSPLIDCVFLLLIFFLVATMLKKDDRDIAITLPESTSDVELLPDDDTLVIGIDPEGNLYWQGRASSANQFHQRLKEVALADPGRRVRLDADAEAPFHRVSEVLTLCQFRGLTNVGIRTYDERYNR